MSNETPNQTGAQGSVQQQVIVNLPPGYGQPVRFAAPPPRSSPVVAVLLELVLGAFQIFGVGHLYGGRIGVALLFMFGYWFLQGANVVVIGLFGGVVTLGIGTVFSMFLAPVLWLVFMVVSAIVAGTNAK